jgi:hypothetical protein
MGNITTRKALNDYKTRRAQKLQLNCFDVKSVEGQNTRIPFHPFHVKNLGISGQMTS